MIQSRRFLADISDITEFIDFIDPGKILPNKAEN